MTIELLLATWYTGAIAIVSGMTVPLGPIRPWAFLFGTATMASSAAVMAYQFVHLNG